MKKVTKAILFLLFISMCLPTFSQMTLGIQGGLNLSKVQLENDEDDEDDLNDKVKLQPGLHAGITFGIPLVKDVFYFEPGLLISMKGFKTEIDEEYFSSKGHANLYYAHIPLNLKTTFGNDNFKGYGILGPYIGIGLSGKTKYTYTYDDGEFEESDSDTETVEWGNDEENDDLKRFDAGLTVGAGFIINGVTLGLSYDFGLANISAQSDDGFSIKNRVIKFSVGYTFNSGKKPKEVETPLMQDGAYTPVPPSGYGSYSYPELVNLQNQAIQSEDYNKAQKIQEEIIRRESSGMYKDIPFERLEQLLNEAVNSKDYNRAARIKNELDSRKK